MCNQGWSNDTEIQVDDEDVHICWEFGINHCLASRAKDRSNDDDPYDNDDNLEDEC